METLHIDLKVPGGWHELSQARMRYAFAQLARDCTPTEAKLLCLLRWNGIKPLGRSIDGKFLLQQGRSTFLLEPIQLAEVLPSLDWLTSPPPVPVRLERIHRLKALPADFSEVPLQTFIICDNLYQGYLHTRRTDLLEQLATVLYPGRRHLRLCHFEQVNVFWWMASLKGWLSGKYPDFFQPAASDDGNLLGSSALSVEDAMNAQIRALTKGDITKEAEVLALDTHRALVELNAQAREYRLLREKK